MVLLSRKSDISIQDLEVSKAHGYILWECVRTRRALSPQEEVLTRVGSIQKYWENSFWLVDLGSRNGTFVNGQRLSESGQTSAERLIVCTTLSFPVFTSPHSSSSQFALV